MSSVFFGIRSSFVCYVDFYFVRCFYIARHLAANFGTKLAAFLYMSSLLWMDDSHLGVTLFSFYSL
jgi:hypothetical protein